MMPKIGALKNESKPVKIGLPITLEPLINPHDFLKSLFFIKIGAYDLQKPHSQAGYAAPKVTDLGRILPA